MLYQSRARHNGEVLGDFDVLSLCDTAAQWYADAAEREQLQLESKLRELLGQRPREEAASIQFFFLSVICESERHICMCSGHAAFEGCTLLFRCAPRIVKGYRRVIFLGVCLGKSLRKCLALPTCTAPRAGPFRTGGFTNKSPGQGQWVASQPCQTPI